MKDYFKIGSGCSHVVYDSTGVTGVTPGTCYLKYKPGILFADAIIHIGLYCGIMV
jgi:hypothetical protein